MNTKLTLTVEQKIIQKAKAYAKRRGRSLSAIIENYLRVLISESENEGAELAPGTKSLLGSFKS